MSRVARYYATHGYPWADAGPADRPDDECPRRGAECDEDGPTCNCAEPVARLAQIDAEFGGAS
jgi:hypothetical protein